MTVENLGLKRALKAKEDFLRENPQMQYFQDELDDQFATFGNDPYVNIQIIRHHLACNLAKLEKIAEEVREGLKND